MINETELKSAIVAFLDVIKMQTEQIASLMVEVSAIRETVRPLDPTFDDTFEAKRQNSRIEVFRVLSKPIAYIDGLTQKIQSGAIF